MLEIFPTLSDSGAGGSSETPAASPQVPSRLSPPGPAAPPQPGSQPHVFSRQRRSVPPLSIPSAAGGGTERGRVSAGDSGDIAPGTPGRDGPGLLLGAPQGLGDAGPALCAPALRCSRALCEKPG